MLTSRDKMFKTDDEEQTQVKTSTDLNSHTVRLLDELAVKIADGNADVEKLNLTPDDVRFLPNGRISSGGTTTLEVEYYAD